MYDTLGLSTKHTNSESSTRIESDFCTQCGLCQVFVPPTVPTGLDTTRGSLSNGLVESS